MSDGALKICENMTEEFQKLPNRDDDKPNENEIPDLSNEGILPVRITYVTPALIEEARTELNETEAVKKKSLEEFRKLIKAEKKLYTPTDDLFLLAFLRSRKYNVKKAFKLLKNYWSFRKEFRHIYDPSNIDSVESLILRNFIGFLHYRDRNGCLIILIKIALWDPEIDSYDEIFRAISGMLVYSLKHEATQIAGFRAIFDLRGMTWQHLKYLTPPNIILLIRSTQFCFPARYKGIHILSENKMIKFVWSLAYPFLTQKLKKRIYFQGEDLNPLQEHIHPLVLPQEFGGQAPIFDNAKWAHVIRNPESLEAVMGSLKYGYRD